MDPVTLVTTALVAGGAAGVSGTASRAAQDSYQALIDAVRRKISGGPEEDQARPEVLDAYLADPVGHYERLVRTLVAAHADRDAGLADAARAIFVLRRRPAAATARRAMSSTPLAVTRIA
ncbi:hypothetical protein OHQ89_17080 [Streptomyces canus]|uniref:hypothetical protein n=1 Tax=Streptomyces canus TaxID=58343 RepID=UPI0030DEE337